VFSSAILRASRFVFLSVSVWAGSVDAASPSDTGGARDFFRTRRVRVGPSFTGGWG